MPWHDYQGKDAVLGTAIASLRDMLTARKGDTLVVGHRGAMGYRPENTMVSFQHALELGADLVELDVHLTKDRQLAVIHDERLERTTNGHGLVRDHTMAELKALDAGAWFEDGAYAGQQIPTLDEVLAWAADRRAAVDVEIKNGPLYYDGIDREVVAALDRAGMAEQAIVISFDHAVVKRVKQLDSRITTGVLFAGKPVDPVALARKAEADAVLPHWAYVTREDVDFCHARGIGVAPWASSDPEVLAHLVRCGVDGLGTNHPDVLRGVLKNQAASRA